MEFTIRKGRPEDAPVIADYNRRMARETEGLELEPEVLARGVARALADPARGVYLVAERAGQVVGQLMYTTEWSDWRDGWFWWIQSVYVAESERGRGVYRALHRHVRASARAAGDVVGIRLYVEENNRRAQATYRGLKMERTHYLVFEECPLGPAVD